MIFIAFTANPVTQTFYAFILMGRIMEAAEVDPSRMLVISGFSLAAGIALFVTAIIQGKLAACCVDALAETRKGFAQYMAVMGAAETVALFSMVLTIASL